VSVALGYLGTPAKRLNQVLGQVARHSLIELHSDWGLDLCCALSSFNDFLLSIDVHLCPSYPTPCMLLVIITASVDNTELISICSLLLHAPAFCTIVTIHDLTSALKSVHLHVCHESTATAYVHQPFDTQLYLPYIIISSLRLHMSSWRTNHQYS
jgi:hypothetical protein